MPSDISDWGPAGPEQMLIALEVEPIEADVVVERSPTPTDALAVVQGVGCIAGGLWPFLHARSFRAVVGPARDMALLRAISLGSVVAGAVLLRRARGVFSRRTARYAAILSAVFAALDVPHIFGADKLKTRRAAFAVDLATNMALGVAWMLRARARPPAT